MRLQFSAREVREAFPVQLLAWIERRTVVEVVEVRVVGDVVDVAWNLQHCYQRKPSLPVAPMKMHLYGRVLDCWPLTSIRVFSKLSNSI